MKFGYSIRDIRVQYHEYVLKTFRKNERKNCKLRSRQIFPQECITINLSFVFLSQDRPWGSHFSLMRKQIFIGAKRTHGIFPNSKLKNLISKIEVSFGEKITRRIVFVHDLTTRLTYKTIKYTKAKGREWDTNKWTVEWWAIRKRG